MPQQTKRNNMLRIDDLSVTYETSEAPVHALRNVSLQLLPGEITAVIGESGSGKTTLGRALLHALPPNAHARWRTLQTPDRIAFVQQEATASLHPLLTVGRQISDVAAARQRSLGNRPNRRELRKATLHILQSLGLTPPELFYDRYPHRMSGGQAQRASLARALALEADLLIADEPTSHLDLITQAEAVKLIHRLTKERAMYTLFITHRLPLVAEIADSVVVLHEGRIVEHGRVVDVWHNPQHEYTQSLLEQMHRLSTHGAEVPAGTTDADSM